WVLPLDGAGRHIPEPLLHSQANEREAVFSPDSHWIAYVSDEFGAPEVYLQPFHLPSLPATSGVGGKILVSKGRGRRPRWRADGRELFYNDPDGTVISVTLRADAALQPGIPLPLFRTFPAWFSTAEPNVDATRFLVAVPMENDSPQPFT